MQYLPRLQEKEGEWQSEKERLTPRLATNARVGIFQIVFWIRWGFWPRGEPLGFSMVWKPTWTRAPFWGIHRRRSCIKSCCRAWNQPCLRLGAWRLSLAAGGQLLGLDQRHVELLQLWQCGRIGRTFQVGLLQNGKNEAKAWKVAVIIMEEWSLFFLPYL